MMRVRSVWRSVDTRWLPFLSELCLYGPVPGRFGPSRWMYPHQDISQEEWSPNICFGMAISADWSPVGSLRFCVTAYMKHFFTYSITLRVSSLCWGFTAASWLWRARLAWFMSDCFSMVLSTWACNHAIVVASSSPISVLNLFFVFMDFLNRLIATSPSIDFDEPVKFFLQSCSPGSTPFLAAVSHLAHRLFLVSQSRTRPVCGPITWPVPVKRTWERIYYLHKWNFHH